jgi:hypothetical protein
MSCCLCKGCYDVYHKITIVVKEIVVCDTCNKQYIVPLSIRMNSLYDEELKSSCLEMFITEHNLM